MSYKEIVYAIYFSAFIGVYICFFIQLIKWSKGKASGDSIWFWFLFCFLVAHAIRYLMKSFKG